MNEDQKLLSRLRQKVSEARAKLEEEERALLVVERMLGVSENIASTQSSSKPTPSRTSSGPTESIVDSVISMLPEFSGTEYTATDIFNRLLDLGKAPSNKSRVSTVLMKLAKKGEILLVSRGAGKSPSIYTEASKEQPSVVSFMDGG